MKKAILAVIGLALVATATFLAMGKPKPTKIRQTESAADATRWATDDELAILVNFTGPDWCTACQFLEGQIFPAESFVNEMADKIVVHNILFPRDPLLRAAISPEEQKRREQLCMSYKVEAFPTVIVTDAKGMPYAVIPGARPTPEDYAQVLKEAFAVREKRDAAFAAAATKTGLERAQLLAEAINLLPAVCRDKYTDVIQEINTLDEQNILGFKNAIINAEIATKQMEELEAFLKTFQGRITPEQLQEDAQRIEAYVAREDLIPEVRQRLYRLQGDNFAFTRNIPKMIEAYEKAINAAPDTRLAGKLKRDVEFQKKMYAERQQTPPAQLEPPVQ